MRNETTLRAFYFCYIERAVSTHNELKEAMNKAGNQEFGGFLVEEIGIEFTKKIDKDAYIYKVTRKHQ
jgi:hypothetical protein